MISIGPTGRIAFKNVLLALRHHQPITPLELGPECGRRHVPDRSSDHVLASQIENLFCGAVEGDETPVGIEREKALGEAVENLVDSQGAGRRPAAFRTEAKG